MGKKNKSKKTNETGAGTQSDMDKLHGLVTRVLIKQIEEGIAEAEQSDDADDNYTLCVDAKALDNALKHLRAGKVVHKENEDEESKEQENTLEEIKRTQAIKVGRASKTRN
ncbi:hypothetical protein [Vibrio sp. Vb1574]|uniref:hypothetical protein n=1 Tax=Vibrio sp. Vb1574 TaxID=3074643 RepID=UPI002963F21F|nr:hypothetical protein [Vibrio sp. Vb1574]MDW1888310.1 hypothetical protein [Vibrio sp. Vb1574]